MADKKLEILIDIKSQIDGLISAEKGLSGLDKTVQQTTSSIGNIQASIQKTALAFGGLAAGIGAFGVAAIKGAGQFEQFNVAFETMLGSSSKAKKLLSDIEQFAVKTPFELPQLVEGSKRLLAYNVAAKDIIPTMQTLGDISAGVGTDKLPQLITAFGQVRAKGKLMGQELLQFTEAGVNLGQALIDTSNGTIRSRTELEKLISAGKIGFPQVQAALDNLAKTQFANLMAKQSETLEGQLSNLNDAIGIFQRQLGEALLPVVKLVVKGLLQVMGIFVNMPKPLKTITAILLTLVFAFSSLVAAAGAVLFVWPTLVEGFKLVILLSKSLYTSLINVVRSLIAMAAQIIYNSVVMIGQFTKALVLGTVNMIAFTLNVWKSIPALIAMSVEFIKNIIPTLLTFGASAAKVGLQFLAGLVGPIVAGLRTIGIAIYTTPFIGWFALAVAAIVGLYFAFKNNFLGIRDIVKKVFEYVAGIVSGMIEFLKNVTNSVVELTQKVFGIKKNIPEVEKPGADKPDKKDQPAPVDYAKEIDAHLEKENKKFAISAAYLQKQRELDQQYRNDTFTANLTELETEKMLKDQELAALDSYYANQLAKQNLSEEEKLRLESEYLLKRNEIQKQSSDLDKKVLAERFTLAKTFFGNLAVLNSDFANVQKGIALGEAVIAGTLAILRALSAPPGFPFNLPGVAFVTAQQAALVGSISAQSFAVGTTNVPQDQLANIHQGEMIIPKSFAEGIRSGEVSLGRSGIEEGSVNGNVEIIVSLKDGLVDFIETEIIKRGRLGGTAIARTG